MKKVHIIFMVWLTAILFLPITLPAQTQIDTIYSTPSMDGMLIFNELFNEKYLTTLFPSICAGDGWDMLEGGIILERAYLHFDLSDLADSCRIINVTLWVYQEMVVGNSKLGVYPIWDIPCGDTLFCMLDHITYGATLDTLDWSAGDVGDPQTLHPKIGIISQDTTIEYKKMDVTEYVRDDLNSRRGRSQFRIAFDIQKSDDRSADFIAFGAGEYYPQKGAPYLIVKYQMSSEVEEEKGIRPSMFCLHQNYPNPFNLETVIRYELPASGFVKLRVFDVGGREVRRLVDGQQLAGFYRMLFSANDLASGIYFYNLQFGDVFQKTGKMVLVR